MKALLPVATALLAVASLATVALAGPPSPAPKKAAKPVAAAAKKTATVYCAVTGEKIGDPSKAVGSSLYKGKTYYFCCAGCKPEFDKTPEKFAKTADTKAKSTTAPKKS